MTAIISEYFGKKNLLSQEISRKLLHFTASFSAAISVILVEDKALLLIISSAALIICFVLVKYNILKSIHHGRSKSWGVFFLPLSFFLLLVFLYPENKVIIFVSLVILAVSDSVAAIIGSSLADKYFYLTSDKKSVYGSTSFFVSTFFVISILFGFDFVQQEFLFDSVLNIFLTALVISAMLTVIEALSSKGTDNLFIPLFASILFLAIHQNPSTEFLVNLSIGVLLAGIVAFISIRLKFLTLSGSAATFILAGFIFGFGGWKWSLPIMAFFILSSLLSKIRKKSNENVETYFEKSGTRDYLQVMANGGLGGVLVIINQLHYSELNYYIYLASLAAVCADTWATEIGTLRKRNTYNILNFKKIEQGTSGGISFTGSLGAVLGAAIIALSGLAWVDLNPVYYFLLMIGTGLIGSFFDSFLGATIQSQGKCNVCFKVTEKDIHCGKSTSHYRGFTWLNNDGVNFLAGLFAGILILIIL